MNGEWIGLRDGRTIDPTRFASFSHVYPVILYKSQSQTVDEMIVAAARLNAKSAYVACSRVRQHCTVFTPGGKRFFNGLIRGTGCLRWISASLIRNRHLNLPPTKPLL